jgi:hypothetical protein
MATSLRDEEVIHHRCTLSPGSEEPANSRPPYYYGCILYLHTGGMLADAKR